MIDALIQGRLHGTPRERTGKGGKPFVTATIRTGTRDGTALFASVIAFHPAACRVLMALADGDSVAVSGECTPKVYQPEGGEPRPSLDVLAHAVLTPYHVKRRREAMTPERTEARHGPDFDDALPDFDVASDEP